MQRVLDATALSLSALCIVHCLALPLLAAALPILGSFSDAPWVHWAVIGAAAPVAVLAIGPVFRLRPIPWLIPGLAAAGLVAMTLGVMASRGWETPLSVVGGAALGVAHVLNWRRAHPPGCASNERLTANV